MNSFALFERLKQSADPVAEKASYEDNNLHYYSPGEELANTLTHAVGVVIGIIGLIFMLFKATAPASYATAVLVSVGFTALYLSSSIYHACTNLQLKRVLRPIDYCSVNFIVISCGTGVALLGGSIVGYGIYAACFALCAVSITLCFVNFAKFRMLIFAINFIIGGLLFSTYFITGIEMSSTVKILNLCGIISVLIGAAIFGVHKPYVHAVFHVFVLVGPVLFLIANYLMLS